MVKAIASVLFIILVIGFCHADESMNPLNLMIQAGKGIAKVGINTMCLADHSDNADIITQMYAIFDKNLVDIKEKVNGPLTQDKLAGLLQILIGGTLSQMLPLDGKCAAATSYCPSVKSTSLSQLGRSLETIGETMVCLASKAQPEILAEIPVVMATELQNVGNLETLNSVNIFLTTFPKFNKYLVEKEPSCGDLPKKC